MARLAMVGRLMARGGAPLVAVALLAAACGGSSSTNDAVPSTLAPTRGGALTVATYIEPAGLDPLVVQSGVLGGIEATAVYDTVVRWDSESRTYQMKTAESVTHNDDYTQWLVKLKPGIRFSDGTAYDAEALKFALDRHRSGLPGAPPCEELRACPQNSAASSGPMATVAATTVVDPLTVRVDLRTSWPGFPAMLAGEPGMVPSPTALRAACPAEKKAAYRDCAFNLSPVGAGPFVVQQFRPGEGITMAANPDYFGGKPLLDGLKFVNFGDAGGQRSYDLLQSDQVDVAFLRDPRVVAKAVDTKLPGVEFRQAAGSTVMMNSGVKVKCTGGEPAAVCAGKPDGPYVPPVPTRDARVRRAVAAAIDPTRVYQRAYNGSGMPGGELFPSWFVNHPDVAGPKYDPDLAKRLVAEAKADGWDGRLRYLTDKAPDNQEVALAVQAMLGAVGITVDITQEASAQLAQFKRSGNYDLASHGFNITDDDMGTARNIAANLRSNSASNRLGYGSAAMDAAIDKLTAASSDPAKKDAYSLIAQQYVADAPFLVLGSVQERPTWKRKVHGIETNVESLISFDRAWFEQ